MQKERDFIKETSRGIHAFDHNTRRVFTQLFLLFACEIPASVNNDRRHDH